MPIMEARTEHGFTLGSFVKHFFLCIEGAIIHLVEHFVLSELPLCAAAGNIFRDSDSCLVAHWLPPLVNISAIFA
jgi:hypothetical protein